MENPSNTIFDDDRDSALKTVVLIFGGLVYLGAVIYSAVHNVSLMLKGVAPDGQPLAILGVICLELRLYSYRWPCTFGVTVLAQDSLHIFLRLNSRAYHDERGSRL
jgi:hypothetical protein